MYSCYTRDNSIKGVNFKAKQEVNRTIRCGDIYSHLEFFQDGGGRHLGFVRTGNSAIRFAVPENPTLEPNGSVAGRWSVVNIYILTLISYTPLRYVT